MPRPNKEKIISDLILELEKGAERKDIISKFCKKFQRTARTIDSYWKIAQERYAERQNKAQMALVDTKIEKEKEALKSALNDKNEHARKLVEKIEDLENDIRELQKIKIGERAPGQKNKFTVNEVLYAKSVIKSIQSEIRAIRTQIGQWYGFNAPQEVNAKFSFLNFLMESGTVDE